MPTDPQTQDHPIIKQIAWALLSLLVLILLGFLAFGRSEGYLPIVCSGLITIFFTVFFVERLNNLDWQDLSQKQFQQQKTLELYEEYDSAAMVESRGYAQRLLRQNQTHEQPSTYYELEEFYKSGDDLSALELWLHTEAVIKYYRKLGNYFKSDLLDKTYFQRFMNQTDLARYYVQHIRPLLQLSIEQPPIGYHEYSQWFEDVFNNVADLMAWSLTDEDDKGA